jgi:hypothetical protein
MNKLFFIPFLFSVLFLFCMELSNPFDLKSSNHLSDTTLNHILNSYDSTFIDTSFVFDTIIHVDTTIHVRDSIQVIHQIHYDTTYVLNTLNDTVHHNFNDTNHFSDTLCFNDTFQITISFIDTTHYTDTVHIQLSDTLYHYDTLVYRDTVIDTIKFYDTKPFLYLINLADSSVLSTYDFKKSYRIAVKAAGVNPMLVKSFLIEEPYGLFNFIPRIPPWSLTFDTTISISYNLKMVTTYGSFSNSYTIYCNPYSINPGSIPVFQRVILDTRSGENCFFKTYENTVPVCTLWTDSSTFGSSPDYIDCLYISSYFAPSIGSASAFDYMITYTSDNGSRVSGSDRKNCPAGKGIEFPFHEVQLGTNEFTIRCRTVAPDTSLWSLKLSMVFVVLDGSETQ